MRVYITGNNALETFLDLGNNPLDKKYWDHELTGGQKQQFRVLEGIGVVEFEVDTNDVSKDGVQKYYWKRKEKLDLKQLDINPVYVNPINKILDVINENEIPDMLLRVRAGYVKGIISSLGYLTKGQRTQLEGFIKSFFEMLKNGKDTQGNYIEATGVRTLFLNGLRNIGIDPERENGVKESGGERIVYRPSEPSKPITAESLREKSERNEREMARRNVPTIAVKNPQPVTESKKISATIGKIVDEESLTDILTARVTRGHSTEEKIVKHPYERKIVKPTPPKSKVERHIYREKKIRPKEETLTSKVLETMFPGLLIESTHEKNETTEGTVLDLELIKKQLDRRITEIDIQTIVPLPPDLYTRWATRLRTTENGFKEHYEVRMAAYVDNLKTRADILDSEPFYRITKVLPDITEASTPEELSKSILEKEGRVVTPRTIKEKIKPLINIGLVKWDGERYIINENFLEENS